MRAAFSRSSRGPWFGRCRGGRCRSRGFEAREAETVFLVWERVCCFCGLGLASFRCAFGGTCWSPSCFGFVTFMRMDRGGQGCLVNALVVLRERFNKCPCPPLSGVLIR